MALTPPTTTSILAQITRPLIGQSFQESYSVNNLTSGRKIGRKDNGYEYLVPAKATAFMQCLFVVDS